MKRQRLLTILLFVMIGCATMRMPGTARGSATMPASAVTTRRYVNTRFGYELRYPAGARLSPADPAATSVKLLLPTGSYPLLVDALPNPKRLPPARWADRAWPGRDTALRPLRLMAAPLNVDGHQAFAITDRQLGTLFQTVYIANGPVMLRLRWPRESNPLVSLSAAPDSVYRSVLDHVRFFRADPDARPLPASARRSALDVDIPSLDVPLFAQNGQSWSHEQLGSCTGLTIGGQGCAVTSKAMIAAYFAITVTIPAAQSRTGRVRRGMDPGILNNWYTWQGGFAQDPTNGGYCLIWASDRGEVPHLHLLNRLYNDNPYGYVDSDKTDLVDAALRDGRPVMAAIHTATVPRHFVVITGRQGDDYRVNDPWSGVKTTLRQGNGRLGGGAYVVDYLWFFRGQQFRRCAAPAALFPAPLTLVSRFDLSFRWQAPACGGVDSYRLRITTSENVQAGPAVVDRVIAGPADHAAVTIPQAYEFRTLFWSLVAHNPAGDGAPGGPWRFVVDRNAVTPVVPPTPTATPTATITPTPTATPTTASSGTLTTGYSIFLPLLTSGAE